ncbi:hypothetical protein [Pedobacter aquatilis]|uniref:hypothetical protein n=1 Tax=Pedobacter aquatilis TaxID=351343 RepID=UPI00292F3B0E|nr:hypothetical protein [Pedobacter aquatilis]
MDIKQQLTEALKLWGYTINELEGMNLFFEGQNLNNQFFRRMMLKNFFSIIEAYLYISRELVLIKALVDGEQQSLHWTEKAILNEQKVGLNQKGEIMLTDSYQNFIPSLRFTLNIFAKTFSASTPDFSDVKFNHLQTMVKRRNEITHPKSYEQVNIKDEEIKNLIPMFAWFMKLHGELNVGFRDWLAETWPQL